MHTTVTDAYDHASLPLLDRLFHFLSVRVGEIGHDIRDPKLNQAMPDYDDST